MVFDMLLGSRMWHDSWVQIRKDFPIKLRNAPLLKKFEEGMDCSQAVHRDIARIGSLVYNEGSPNFAKFKITPNAEYIITNPRLNLWQGIKSDPNIWDRVAGVNEKYDVQESNVELDREYDLFLLQMAQTKDLKETVDALFYATKNKRYTVFKKHPVVGDGTDFDSLWEVFKQKGIVSDYTVLLDGGENESLIRGASLVYSADSAVTYNAVLQGKPVATYRDTDLSEIVPVIKSARNIADLRAPNRKDVEQFLTWYHDRLIVDVTLDGYKDKRDHVINMYMNGASTGDIFK